jgi:hypothetical protein
MSLNAAIVLELAAAFQLSANGGWDVSSDVNGDGRITSQSYRR